MKAAVFVGPREIKIQEVAKPVPGPGEALVRVGACGLCGSDITFYNGVPDYIMKFPLVPGHELAGLVDEINGDGKGLKVGDPVAVEPLINCGKCYACRVGEYNCCANLKVVGAHVPGGFAEYLVVPAHRCHKIPASMPFYIGAACEPYSIGANVVRRGQVTQDDRVVVNGAGAIGLSILELAKNVRGARVLVTDLIEQRLERAKAMGADQVVNAGREDVNERVMQFTGGEGASVVIDATGQPSAIGNMENQVAAAGRCVIVGYSDHRVSFGGVNIIKKEMTILGSRNSCNQYPHVIEVVAAGKVHPDKLVTHRFAFERIHEAFALATDHPDQVGKVVVELPL